MSIEVILLDWGGTLASVSRQAAALRTGASRAAAIIGEAAGPGEIDALVGAILSAEAKAAADPTHREADLFAVLAEWARSVDPAIEETRLRAAGEALGDAWVGCLDLYDHSMDTLKTLSSNGLRLALVSNCCLPVDYCRREVARQGLADLLEFTVFSSEVGYRKPSPAIYEAALANVAAENGGVEPGRILFVGDSPMCDVIAPAEMGMRTALVSSPPGAWPEEDHTRARPDLRIETIAELPDALRELR